MPNLPVKLPLLTAAHYSDDQSPKPVPAGPVCCTASIRKPRNNRDPLNAPSGNPFGALRMRFRA